MLYAASSDPALPWPPAPFHDPFHTSKCLYGLGAFPKGSPHPLNVAPKDAVFPVVFSVTLFLFSHPMLLRPEGGVGILWGPQTACRTVRPSGYTTLIHCWTHHPLASGSCPFLENDPTTAASSWSTLTSGATPSSTLTSQVLSHDLCFHSSLSTATSWNVSSPITALPPKSPI